MISESENFNDRDEAVNNFAKRHDILKTEMVRREGLGIYWALQVKKEIDDQLREIESELDDQPSWGLFLSMLDRTFEYLEGAITAYVTGSTATSEIVSRSVIESATNLVYILTGDENGERLAQYFRKYFNNENDEIEKWLKIAKTLPQKSGRIHKDSAFDKREYLRQQKNLTNIALSQIGLLTTDQITTKWPNIFERFRKIGLEIDYRTIYSALSSQTHSDAEDLLNYFIFQALGDEEAVQEIAMKTVTFSRLMLYFGIQYYLIAAGAYAIRFELTDTLKIIDKGREKIRHKLGEIALMLR